MSKAVSGLGWGCWIEVGQGMEEAAGSRAQETRAAAGPERPCELRCLVSRRNQDLLLVGFGYLIVYLF